jgi:hypothetical protein
MSIFVKILHACIHKRRSIERERFMLLHAISNVQNVDVDAMLVDNHCDRLWVERMWMYIFFCNQKGKSKVQIEENTCLDISFGCCCSRYFIAAVN